MQTSTWITMIVIMAIVWGGFIRLLTMAMRAESDKDHSKEGAPSQA